MSEQTSKEEALKEDCWKIVKPNEAGLCIWRVNKLKLEIVPKEQQGVFFDGDTYLVLHSVLNKSRVDHKFYHWIGIDSSQDEYSFGAFKMVELDSHILSDAAIQYRIPQGSESEEFLGIFKNFQIRHGGYDTGFKVTKKEDKPTLFHISGIKKNVRVMEIELCQENITSDDCYLIDLGDEVHTFIGATANKDEKMKCSQYLSQYKSQKPSAKYFCIDESSDGRPNNIFSKFPQKSTGHSIMQMRKAEHKDQSKYILLRVSDESGVMKFTQVSVGKPKRSDLDSNDIFILNTFEKVFVWVGNKSNKNEQRSAMIFSGKYVSINKLLRAGIEVIKEGFESEEFSQCFC